MENFKALFEVQNMPWIRRNLTMVRVGRVKIYGQSQGK